jgi:ribonucleoside-diphosphate reductase alpha chain
MATLCHSAYHASIDLAREKGAFPFFEAGAYLKGAFVARLPEDIRQGIAQHGIRNSHLIAIAPTGTISLVANNVSSGLEPIFDLSYRRSIIERDGSRAEHDVDDYAYALWREQGGTEVPGTFVTAHGISPEDHLAMQAALQPYIDNSISKTINIPVDYPFEQFRELYGSAYAQGLKGCTTFRPNPVTGSILTTGVKLDQATPCCGLEREGD